MQSKTVSGFEVIVEDGKHLSSEQISQYDFQYLNNVENGVKYRLSSIVSITVFKNGEQIKSALIGGMAGGTGVHKNSVIFEKNRIVICCSNMIVSLSVPSLYLLWKSEVEWATCFKIFSYQTDYIVHGETTITRLSQNGNIVWQQGGSDIFLTIEGKEDDFTISEDYISAKDFEYRKYKFDFDGNILES